HSAWWLGNCVVQDGDSPRRTSEGAVETRLVFFPASQGELIDTWTVGGMRGTGSHDYAIRETFIPAERTIASPFQAPSRLPDPLYQLPIMALLDNAMAAVPLKHIPSGWNQPDGICPLIEAPGATRFRYDGTASGFIISEPAPSGSPVRRSMPSWKWLRPR